ncbi:uncharacterized protein F5147DRAFT_391262 [Suillus discolor]|uniref:Uncharacterized protein n=1 Tax=Suillus discolor TaxID=1912936 RepID=A0A9P7JPQ4_9AGAM|nr:uncharacterized protein F5147DRAFT_391262 [Suillus discolor]KAG2096333.1 hypothetical protein F5147DRAFT_391262 [Suillus discolor]
MERLNFRNLHGLWRSIYAHSSLACPHSFTALHLKVMHQMNFSNPPGPSTSSRLYPHVFLDRLSSLFPRSRLNTDEEVEHRPTMLSSSPPDGRFISRLSSLFRSQPHTNERIELSQRPSRPHVVDVAAVRDKQSLVVTRRPNCKKAKRAYEQRNKLHAQAQASSSGTQPAHVSTLATPPVPGTNTTTIGAATSQSQPIPWWGQIVLFLCCASPPHANSH